MYTELIPLDNPNGLRTDMVHDAVLATIQSHRMCEARRQFRFFLDAQVATLIIAPLLWYATTIGITCFFLAGGIVFSSPRIVLWWRNFRAAVAYEERKRIITVKSHMLG